MTVILRNRLIGWGFELGALWARKRLRWASPGRLRLGSLDHITIPVKDLALAREFYCDVLGASYFMTVDDETFRRFGRPPAPITVKVLIISQFTQAARCALVSACWRMCASVRPASGTTLAPMPTARVSSRRYLPPRRRCGRRR